MSSGQIHTADMFHPNSVSRRAPQKQKRSATGLAHGEIVGDRAGAATGNEFHILGEHTGAVARMWRFPLRATCGQFLRCDVKIETVRRSVNCDFVTFANECDTTAYRCFGSYVSDDHPVSAAGKAAVGDERHRIAEA